MVVISLCYVFIFGIARLSGIYVYSVCILELLNLLKEVSSYFRICLNRSTLNIIMASFHIISMSFFR